MMVAVLYEQKQSLSIGIQLLGVALVPVGFIGGARSNMSEGSVLGGAGVVSGSKVSVSQAAPSTCPTIVPLQTMGQILTPRPIPMCNLYLRLGISMDSYQQDWCYIDPAGCFFKQEVLECQIKQAQLKGIQMPVGILERLKLAPEYPRNKTRYII